MMARPKKPEDELKDQRVTIMMSESELSLIDDWMFANRLRSRGEAIRRLCIRSLSKDLKMIEEARMKKIAFGDDDER